MAEFRLYFCDDSDHIIARLEFCAPSDSAGLAVAAIIAEASNDQHCGYTLWREKRVLYSSRDASELQRRRFGNAPMPFNRQELIVQLEENLLDSHWCLARSARLLEATAQLRDKRDR